MADWVEIHNTTIPSATIHTKHFGPIEVWGGIVSQLKDKAMKYVIEDNQEELYSEYHALLRVAKAAKAAREEWLKTRDTWGGMKRLEEALKEVEHLLDA
jgi:hypothetical protein